MRLGAQAPLRESGVGGNTVTGGTSCDTHIAKSYKRRALFHRGEVGIEGVGRRDDPDIQRGTVGRKRCLDQMQSGGQNSPACVCVCMRSREGAPCVP